MKLIRCGNCLKEFEYKDEEEGLAVKCPYCPFFTFTDISKLLKEESMTKNEQCYCKYTIEGKLVGLCLRCSKREMKAFNRGKKWTFKKIISENNKLMKKWV